VSQENVDRRGNAVEIQRLREQASVPVLSSGVNSQEPMKLLLARPRSVEWFVLHLPKRRHLALLLDDPFDALRADGTNELVLEVGDAYEEAERPQPRSIEITAEAGVLKCPPNVV
jgi:hypothetical protein